MDDWLSALLGISPAGAAPLGGYGINQPPDMPAPPAPPSSELVPGGGFPPAPGQGPFVTPTNPAVAPGVSAPPPAPVPTPSTMPGAAPVPYANTPFGQMLQPALPSPVPTPTPPTQPEPIPLPQPKPNPTNEMAAGGGTPQGQGGAQSGNRLADALRGVSASRPEVQKVATPHAPVMGKVGQSDLINTLSALGISPFQLASLPSLRLRG